MCKTPFYIASPDATARATNLLLQLRCQRCQRVDGVGLCGNRSHLRPPHSPLTPSQQDQPRAQTRRGISARACQPQACEGAWICGTACGVRPRADHGLGGRGHGRHDHRRDRLRKRLRSDSGPRVRLQPRPCRPTLSSRRWKAEASPMESARAWHWRARYTPPATAWGARDKGRCGKNSASAKRRYDCVTGVRKAAADAGGANAGADWRNCCGRNCCGH
jgi:hypothetical protein